MPTLSEREALEWVVPGTYTVTLRAAGGSISKNVEVTPEGERARRVHPRY
jgi:hypothetical protein